MVLGVALAGCARQAGDSPRSPSKDHTVVSLLRVSLRPDSITNPANTPVNLQEYKIFKATQAQLLRSPVVLTAALRKPGIAALSIYQREEADPIAWLRENLDVSFPGDSEIMQVSLTDPNTAEAVTVLRAVVDAYLSEIVETERNRRARELANLEEILAGKEREIRQKRTTLKQLANELGTADRDTLAMQMQLAAQQLGMYQQELLQAQAERRKSEFELRVLRAMLRRLEKQNPADDAARGAAARRELQQVTQELSVMISQLAQVVTQLSEAEVSQMFQTQLATIQQQIAAWQGLLGLRLADLRRAELREKIEEAEIRVTMAAEEVADLEKEVEKAKKEFQRLGQSSVEIEMMRTDLQNLEKVVSEIATKRQMLEVETKSQPRIRLLQRAEIPSSNKQGVP